VSQMASQKRDKDGKIAKHAMDRNRSNKEVGYMRSAATVRCLNFVQLRVVCLGINLTPSQGIPPFSKCLNRRLRWSFACACKLFVCQT
jgi:hypothetical protein